MIAGIGLFLLGTTFLEEALSKLAGRSFKVFLKEQTNNKLKAVASGAIVTAVLQSSSVVGLMVLAFVGSGVLAMQNALSVILGANIGTTLTSWIVATLGFKINIESLAYPIVGIFGIAMTLFPSEHKGFHWSKFMLGFGLLFIGLSFMKSGFEEVANGFDFAVLNNYSIIVFVLAGFVLTSLIQSSSATVAIILTALNSDAITLLAAMAMVLGSEVGTTIKLLIASVKGIAAKKRVAFGNFIYNTFIIVVVLIALKPINTFIIKVLAIQDDLLALVMFQSGINILGVIVFFPFITAFGKLLNNMFTEDSEYVKYIASVPSLAGGGLALDALEKETRRFMLIVIDFITSSFSDSASPPVGRKESDYKFKSVREKYDYLKQVHGEMHAYAIKLNSVGLNTNEQERLDRINSSIRNSMFAAKSVKDTHHDIDQFKNSSNDVKYQIYQHRSEELGKFYERLSGLLTKDDEYNAFEDMVDLYNTIQKGYTEELNNLYKEGIGHQLSDMEISTLINFNREVYNSYKAIVWAAKDILLTKNQAQYFGELPGFIR
ncbi:MAG: Na/Pi cotransporter family protein [Cyclobacteriaceae bacterium]|nr:Na/Pi cotransporter family protein [Cyclobacteriaceae bacterium]